MTHVEQPTNALDEVFKAHERLDAALDEWNAMSDALFDDVMDCSRRMDAKPIATRQFVRAAFADIEGGLAAMRGLALGAAGISLGK